MSPIVPRYNKPSTPEARAKLQLAEAAEADQARNPIAAAFEELNKPQRGRDLYEQTKALMGDTTPQNGEQQ